MQINLLRSWTIKIKAKFHKLLHKLLLLVDGFVAVDPSVNVCIAGKATHPVLSKNVGHIRPQVMIEVNFSLDSSLQEPAFILFIDIFP